MTKPKRDIVDRLQATRADMLGSEDEEHFRDCHDAVNEIRRLRAAIKPFAEVGERLASANQKSDQSVLIGASARFLNLEPLTGQAFVEAHKAMGR